MTDNDHPDTMTDADLLKRYRRALAEIMTEDVEVVVYHAACRALFGGCVSIWTHCNPLPIPDRSHDWSAIDEATYEAGEPVGYGETEVEAILDLIDKMGEKNND